MEIQYEKLQKPVNVSPLIKGARWSLFAAGFFYGMNKLALYRAIDKIEKPKRDELKKELKLQKAEEDQKSVEETLANIRSQL